MSQASCLYVGEIEHRRFSPKENNFTYKVLYYFLDLEEIKGIFNIPLLFSYNLPGILSFWRKDYFGNSNESLRESIENFIFKEKNIEFKGKIRVMTNISYFGFCFNPVTFYYCYSQDGKELQYIISDITNTPWGERHLQLFEFEGEQKKVFRFPKEFHVSPFMPMSVDYTWVFERPNSELNVLMQNRFSGQRDLFFDSTLNLTKKPLTLFNIVKYFIQFPLTTFKTMAAIYYQAAKLFLKKVPFYSHP